MFFSSFIIQNLLSIFFRKLVKSFLLFGIQNFIFRNHNIKSFNLNTKIIPSCCSVSSLSVSCLNNKHSLAIGYILLKKTWTIANCLIGFSVKEIRKISFSNCHIVFTTRYSNLALFRTELLEIRCFTFNHVLIFENTHGIDWSFATKESNGDLSI